MDPYFIGFYNGMSMGFSFYGPQFILATYDSWGAQSTMATVHLSVPTPRSSLVLAPKAPREVLQPAWLQQRAGSGIVT
jgi:hypothetical protein